MPRVPTPRNERHRRPPLRPAAGRGLVLSLGVHVGLLAVLGASRPNAPAPGRPPIAFAVEASLLQDAAPPARPETSPPPPAIEVEPVTEPIVEPPLPDEPDANEDPATLSPPDTVLVEATPPRRLADCASSARAPIRRPPPAPPAEPTEPPTAVAAPPAPASAAPAAARPEVPVPIPGQNPAPDYPDSARRRRIEGTVLVRIDVDANGSAGDCAVAQGSGCLALDHAALAAARRWRFDRGPGHVEVPFVFQLLRSP
jgi:protein TonB